MPTLLDPFTLKDLTLRNRIVMPPMCQYSVEKKDGTPNDWHFVYYTSRAVGGAGLIIIEMTDVEPDGRITNHDLGLWSDEQITSYAKIVDACHQYGAKVAIQIGHAGRKAQDAAIPVSCSPIPYSDKFKTPKQLTTEETEQMVQKFKTAVARAVKAGVDTVEIHGAHGYLIHQFQSPYTNKRTDKYGQDKALFGTQVIRAAKEVLPDTMPLIMRISSIEYVEGGYGIDYSIELCKRYKEAGVDIFHISSGGEGPIGSSGRPGAGPGYQVEFAEAIKKAVDVPVIAVGRLEDSYLADKIVREEKVDLVAVGRGMLSNPYWANDTSLLFRGEPITPKAYERAYSIKR